MKKYKDEFITLLVSTLLSASLSAIVESESSGNALVLIPYGLIILIFNYLFEHIHANKRAIFGGRSKPILFEVIFSSGISLVIMCILITICTTMDIFNYWLMPVLCSLSIIIGYFLNYVRFKGKKGIYVLLFSSERKIHERVSLYQLESLYDKEKIDIIDILILYGYITFKEVEEARLIFSTMNIQSLEEFLKISGKVTEDDLEEAQYLLEQYNETHTFMSKKDFKNYRLERRLLLERVKGE